MIVRRFLVLSCILACVDTAGAQATSLEERIDSARSSRSLRNAQWSITAIAVDNDSTIVSINPALSLAPASCLKLVTTAAGLSLLGGDYQFTTRVYAKGSLRGDGVLKGNLVIVGGGDPTLGSDLTPGSLGLDSLMSTWVEAVRRAGIRSIKGSVVADDFLFDRVPIPDDWFWIDIGNYYATSTSALTIHDNLYRLFFKPGKRVGDPATVLRTEPEIPGLRFVNHMKTGRAGSGDNGYVYCAPDQWKAVLRGTIPAGVKEFDIKGSIPDPPLFAAEYFTAALKRSGIRISGPAQRRETQGSYDDATLVTTTTSPSLRDILTVINKRSFNLYAEQLLKTIGLTQLGEGSTEKGIEAIRSFLEGLRVNVEGLEQTDGCGLARTNGITTRTIAQLLAAMNRGPHARVFYESISVAGDSLDIGYFKSFGVGTELQYNARIKSGTIQGVRSYAGYLRDLSGRLIAFAVIANNYSGRGSEVDALHRGILLELARLGRDGQ